MSKVNKRYNSFALTGNTNNIRPYLMLLLMKKGFHIVQHPSRGIKGLICGDAHAPSKTVTSHMKYKKAVKNDVPIITMDKLPQVLGVADLLEEINILKKEIVMIRCGDSL